MIHGVKHSGCVYTMVTVSHKLLWDNEERWGSLLGENASVKRASKVLLCELAAWSKMEKIGIIVVLFSSSFSSSFSLL